MGMYTRQISPASAYSTAATVQTTKQCYGKKKKGGAHAIKMRNESKLQITMVYMVVFLVSGGVKKTITNQPRSAALVCPLSLCSNTQGREDGKVKMDGGGSCGHARWWGCFLFALPETELARSSPCLPRLKA